MTKKNEKDKISVGEVLGEILLPVCGLALIGALVWIAVGFFNDLSKASKETTEQTITIKSISYQTETSGSFALGFGSIDNAEYYVCYEVLEDGGVKLLKLDASKTTIYETLEKDESAYVNMEVNKLGETKNINLYVPKDTIQTQYDLTVK
ncbi:hypothetical protein OBV_p-00170 (plasmid) [Oscillibacter valericigenes Sjm18-20]|nr:hypothetical protein OBV_p-00170 [Oscillibacter valericigenes Sjm18-20]